MSTEFEDQVLQLDQALADAEKQAKALLGRIRGLRKRASGGELATLPALFDQLPAQAEQVIASAQAARDGLVYDSAAALADGSYLAELQAEAKSQGVAVIERDGRLTAFPLLLKLDPRAPGVRIGRSMERRLRPSVIVKLLGKAQAVTRFDVGRFLNQLFGAYSYIAPAKHPGWKPGASGDGPAILLDDIYSILTLHPAASAEYSREAFACDLLRLDRAPDTKTSAGQSFSLPASTGSKGSNRLTVYDERGIERLFVAIRFSRATE